MKKITTSLLVLLCLAVNLVSAQEIPQLTPKDSIVQSSWMFGLGYNIVDDSGDVFNGLFDVNTQWNTLAYPSRLSVGRYFKNGLGVSAIGTYNKYKEGKIIDGIVNAEDSDYFGIDARISFDLNKIIGETAWFDPYVGVGAGYTDANNTPRSTYNAVIGFRTWFSDRWGLDFSSSGKWRTGDIGTNHIQHAAGVVYQFGIEKGLSKKGADKLALIDALQAEKQRVNDSLATVEREKEALALAERLAKEKESARLAAVEKAKLDAENRRRQDLRDQIDALGHVYFDLNSSYVNKRSKVILDALAVILNDNPELKLRVSSHTDSRGKAEYNKWLSERRVQRTVDYLIAKGIADLRLETQAYGEENLLNECDDNTYCTEGKHQVNRRSEFAITAF